MCKRLVNKVGCGPKANLTAGVCDLEQRKQLLPEELDCTVWRVRAKCRLRAHMGVSKGSETSMHNLAFAGRSWRGYKYSRTILGSGRRLIMVL